MATVVFSRSTRATSPPMPRGDLLLESLPEAPLPSTEQPFGAVAPMRRRNYASARSDES